MGKENDNIGFESDIEGKVNALGNKVDNFEDTLDKVNSKIDLLCELMKKGN